MDTWKTQREALVSALQNSPAPDQLDDSSKTHLLTLLGNVSAQVQTRGSFLQSLTQDGNRLVIARVAIAMGIFDAFAAQNFTAMTTDDLCSKTKGDRKLLVRILRMLVASKMVEQLSISSWKPTSTGAMLVSGTPPAMMVIHHYYMSKCSANFLEFLESTDFREPDDYYKSPWGYALNTDKGYFDWLSSGEKLRLEAFNTMMSIAQSFRGQNWFEFYPMDRLPTTTDRVMLVDVGAGIGHDVIALKNRYPDLSGRIVIQDLPSVIETIKEPLPPGVEAQGHDIFTPQMVKGAKTYYIRNVIHDWPDKQALEILQSLKGAMSPDSVLLINDDVMEEQNATRMAADADFIMMRAFGSLERTEAQWRDLIEAAGLKIVKIWKPTKPAMIPFAMFEARLP